MANVLRKGAIILTEGNVNQSFGLNLGSVFKKEELSLPLYQARDKIYKEIERKKTQANLEELSDFFTKLFYSKHKEEYETKINQAWESDTKDTIIERLNQFMGDTQNNRTALQTQIYISTVENKITDLLGKINNLAKQPAVNLQMIDDIRNTIHRVESDILPELKKQGKQIRLLGEKYKSIDVNGDINFLLNLLNILSSTPPQNKIGDVFEEMLVEFVNNYSANISNYIRRNFALGTGNFSIQRGTKEEVKYNYVNEDENIHTSYVLDYNPFAPKKGKMDVKIFYEDENRYINDLRLSAKSWGDGAGDLGSTGISAAIMRVSGKSVAECYELAVLRANTDAPHNYAPYAIKSDVAMGLTQKQGWANILIIDDRANKRIRCIDLSSMVTHSNLSGYNASDINDTAHEMLKLLDTKGIRSYRTSNYFGLMTKHLNDLKVTINTSANAKF